LFRSWIRRPGPT